jgi:hypothetical protein
MMWGKGGKSARDEVYQNWRKIMFRVLMLVLAVAVLAGCKPQTEETTAPSTPEATKPRVPLDVTPGLKSGIGLNTGDVEQTIFFNITLAPQSRAANIVIDEKADRRDMIRFSEIVVHPPHPAELVFDVLLMCRNNFTNQPVVLRGQYVVDGEAEVGSLKYVLSGVNNTDYPMGSFTVPGLAAPASVLLTLDAEASLTEQDTRPEGVDPDTFTAPEEMRTRALNSTAVRIDFVNEPAPERPVEEEQPPAFPTGSLEVPMPGVPGATMQIPQPDLPPLPVPPPPAPDTQ